MQSYDAPESEKKWQAKWRESGIFKVDLDLPDGKEVKDGKGKSKRKSKGKYYNLTMFPYPSGDKLHVGHWYNYGPVDTWGRYVRMQGYDVFQPMGFDSFGLPAENYAIKTGVHPAETTRANIDKMTEQFAAIGGMYDMDLGIETSSPEYYKWTQWMFLQLYKKGLAYRKEAPVNWCNSCQTVLANEQVVEGICERCKEDVVQKNLTQWFFKITDYAEELLDYEGLDWPAKTIAMQKNWIGRSEGCDFKCKIKDFDYEFNVYDSVPQTHMAQTFAVIAAEHPILPEIVKGKPEEKETLACIKRIKKKKMSNRFDVEEDMDGAFTGCYIDDPYGTGDLPLWVASFAVADYGSGIVNCSAHDERDFLFAKKFDIPLRPVMFPEDPKEAKKVKNLEYCYHHEDEGVLVAPEKFKGRKWGEAREDIIEYIEKIGIGKRTVNYRLRDWLISRQRYWGAPIPIIYCDKCGEVPVPDKDLPVVHPHVEDFVPKGKSPLANAEDFVHVKCPKCGGDGHREVDTMDTFVCSSWYFLRYPDAANEKKAWDKKKVDKWMPVDMYIGGPEHACMHLLYARFVHKAMHDLGHVDSEEPFARLVHQGMVTKDGAKMSKSKGNVVSPDKFVEKYGSDVFRMYLMFMGPFTEGGDWNDQGIMGVVRWVDRFFRMMQADGDGKEMNVTVHKTVAKAGKALESMCFNIAIASLMELTNEGLKKGLGQEQKEVIAKVIAPLAPHLAEEVWEMLGHDGSVFDEEWPVADEKFLVEDTVTFAVQVNGKLRGTIDLAVDVDEKEAIAAAKEIENVVKYLEEGEIKKEVFVPGKIVGFVVK
jgi:leucyl-tRNA synthetase